MDESSSAKSYEMSNDENENHYSSNNQETQPLLSRLNNNILTLKKKTLQSQFDSLAKDCESSSLLDQRKEMFVPLIHDIERKSPFLCNESIDFHYKVSCFDLTQNFNEPDLCSHLNLNCNNEVQTFSYHVSNTTLFTIMLVV